MPQNKEISEAFVLEFVRELVRMSYKEQKSSPQKITPPSVVEVAGAAEQQSQFQLEKINYAKPITKIIDVSSQTPQRILMKGAHSPPEHLLPQLQALEKKNKIDLPSMPSPTEYIEINLGKITPIIYDPSVIGIECPGPAKNLLVNKSNAIQVAPISLTKEEIEKLINEVSNKTRIPVVFPGLFRAVINDLIITAVTSEFVGSRFIIEKRTPFKNY